MVSIIIIIIMHWPQYYCYLSNGPEPNVLSLSFQHLFVWHSHSFECHLFRRINKRFDPSISWYLFDSCRICQFSLKKEWKIFFLMCEMSFDYYYYFLQIYQMWSDHWCSSWSVHSLTKKGNYQNVFNPGLGKPRKYHIIQFQMFRCQNGFGYFYRT